MDEVFRKLYATADTLARDSSPPVELRSICDRFGIIIRRSTSRQDGLKRAFLFQRNDATEIVLPEGAVGQNSFTIWDRFLIAHELGHYFLSELKAPKPLGPQEYWETERICDRFARRLLLPTREVPAVIADASKSATEFLSATAHLHLKWAVPWPVAAHQVAECSESVHFFRIVHDQNQFRVKVSTLPEKRQTGRKIPAMSPLGSLLQQFRQTGGSPEQIPLSQLHDFDLLANSSDAAVHRVGLKEYRVAALPVRLFTTAEPRLQITV